MSKSHITIKVMVKKINGIKICFPACIRARRICDLIKTPYLEVQEIKQLELIGFRVEVVCESLKENEESFKFKA